MPETVAETKRSQAWIVWLVLLVVALAAAGCWVAYRAHVPQSASAPRAAAASNDQATTAVSGLPLAPIPPLDSPVVDATGGALSAASRQRLEQQAFDLQRRTGSQLQVVVVPTTRPQTIEQYATRVFDQWKLGRKGINDGVLVLVARDDKRVRVEVGYGLERAISDEAAKRIIDQAMVPRFRADDFDGGLEQGTAQLVPLIEAAGLPPPAVPT